MGPHSAAPRSLERVPTFDREACLAMIPPLERQGFLRIPIDGDLRHATDQVFASADEFFARSPAEKRHFAQPAWVEGYREQGPEYSQVPERPDLTESFSIWHRNRARAQLDAWAAACPLHPALRHASDMLSDMARGLFAAMAEYWGSADAPELRFQNGTWTQLNHYEPARHTRELLQDPHEDGHLITFVLTNAPGLEIEVDGEFVPAGIDRNELLVMPGSLLSLMTGYRVKPLYHQVRNTYRTDPRSSLLYFVNPEIDQHLAPWIANESNKGIDIVERANAGPTQFGLPSLAETMSGEAETPSSTPAKADAAQ